MAGSISALVPELRELAAAFVGELGRAGLQPRVTSTLRTRGQQARLYRRYLTGISTLPAAPPGGSAHEYGWAFDLVVLPAYQTLVGEAWIEIGGAWGGAGDPVHFELPGASARARSFVQQPAVRPESTGWAAAFDFLIGFTPYGAAQLIAWLVEMGFGQSTATYLVQNPSQIPGEVYSALLNRALGAVRR